MIPIIIFELIIMIELLILSLKKTKQNFVINIFYSSRKKLYQNLQ